MISEANILQLSSNDEENHTAADLSQRDLFEELKAWRREFARLDKYLSIIASCKANMATVCSLYSLYIQ